MADDLSITNAISGLLPLVRDKFVLIRDAFLADRKLRLDLGRAELRMTIFQAWDECWTDSDERLDKKISEFAQTDTLLARAILQQLVLLLRTLSDSEKLKRRYGLLLQVAALHRSEDIALEMKYASSYLLEIDSDFTTKHLAIFNENRMRHMAFLQKLRFNISGTESDLNFLFGRLDEFNRNLQLLTPPTMRSNVDRKLFELAVKDIGKDPDRTRRLEEGAAYEAKHSIDLVAQVKLDDLSKLANFTLAIQSASPGMPRRKIFGHADLSFDTPYYINKNTTLARLFDYPTKYQSRLVLVEWITLTIGASGTTLESIDEAKVTWYILHAEKPQKLLLPGTIGLIVDESDPWRVGMVYQLPPHIRGNLPTKIVMGGRAVRSPKTIAAERMPTSLRQLMLKQPKGLDLGIRFQIAKALLDAVHMMHVARFTHRNIRPDNILFFPAADKNNDPVPTRLDFANPIIFGFHDARLEIQISTDPPVPWTQPEGLKPILKKPHRTRDVVIDAYSHPEWRLDPRRRDAPFRRHFDLYSVGCVLLELGLWETLDQMEVRDIALRAPGVGEVAKEGREGVVVVDKGEVYRDYEVLERAAKRLDVVTGRIYAEVTRECLFGERRVGDILEHERRLAAALAQVMA